MSRCNFDATFYRVFCLTLLAIAFSFTVILTNVFIDIDGLIAKKSQSPATEKKVEVIAPGPSFNDDSDSGDSDDAYRTKRSVDFPEEHSLLCDIKHPEVKNMLTAQLSRLLEKMDEDSFVLKLETKNPEKDNLKDAESLERFETQKVNEEDKGTNDELLHLKLNNILLQGVVGHMDTNEVYKRTKSLMEKLTTAKKSKVEIPEKSKVMINTIIYISSEDNKARKEEYNATNPTEDIKSAVELIYNGKITKLTPADTLTTDMKQISPKTVTNTIRPNEVIDINYNINPESLRKSKTLAINKIPKSYINQFINEYFKHFDKENTKEITEKYQTKRLKRNLKIKYDTSKEIDYNKKKNPGDDELFVEIETHFDSKGIKGEKKKKIIKNLIDKIQTALHSEIKNTNSDTPNKSSKNKLRPNLHIKKRIQTPLDHKEKVLVNQFSLPLETILHRQLDPMAKAQPVEESMPYVSDKSGENWKRLNYGPAFLSAAKTINSAEMSELAVDYSKVLDEIPKRIQTPLNKDEQISMDPANNEHDLNNMKFLLKDIDGSGFSVGINQYVDEAPDIETMKLFTGLENVIKTYHQNYDDTATDRNFNEDAPLDDGDEHVIVRRSINKHHDYHSNEYKVIFDKNFLPYKSYQDIFESKKYRTNIDIKRPNNIFNSPPLVIDDKIFYKKLKPAEILGLANLFERKKRSIKVHRMSNLKNRIKINRFLNTKAIRKRIFVDKKRNKRQINKIRIIATDHSSHAHRSQTEDNLFVVSNENVFADRATIKEVNAEEESVKDEDEDPYQVENLQNSYITKMFNSKSRHNPLMSKYPHIFLEEITKSKEEELPENTLVYGEMPSLDSGSHNIVNDIPDKDSDKNKDVSNTEPTDKTPILNKSGNIIEPKQLSYTNYAYEPFKNNYKVTVKVTPKNITGLNSGFKEIHTSINKRFNKNGLMYSSLVNVSEISNIVKLNKTKEDHDQYDKALRKQTNPQVAMIIKKQQDNMQTLLKEHQKHIQEQLLRLKEEKSTIDHLLTDDHNITDTDTAGYDYVDLLVPLDPPKIVHLKKDDVQQLALSALLRDDTSVTSTTHKTTTTPMIKTTVTHTPVTTTAPTLTENIKKNIIKSIERNQNTTDEILKKIDRNTEMMQLFLKKLSEKILAPSKKIIIETTTQIPNKDVKKTIRHLNNPFPYDWTKHAAHFNGHKKNDTLSIPFVYAYQHPIIGHKLDSPIASVVYHGHIHTNTINDINDHSIVVKSNDVPRNSSAESKVEMLQKIDVTSNQTKFFIDDLGGDYKVIPMDVKVQQNIINGTVS